MLIVKTLDIRGVICPAHSILASMLLSLFVLQSAAGDERLPFDSIGIDDKIAQLVEELDSDRFAERELAADRLAEIGSPALRPLAINALDSSPETAWRTRKTLELIGTKGDESVFYQSIGILQLLFPDGNNSAMQRRVAQLERDWKLERKKATISQFRKLGAIVSDPSENRVAFNGDLRRQFIVNNAFVNDPFGDPTIEILEPTALRPAKPRATIRRGNLNVADMTKQIDNILLASLEDNRKTIFGTSRSDSAQSKSKKNDAAQRQLQLGQRILIEPARLRAVNVNGGITVTFTDKWQGTLEELQRLENLQGLSRIELSEFNPGRQQLNKLSELNSVTEIHVIGEQIPDEDLSILRSIPRLATLEFSNRKINAETLQEFADLKPLANVKFSECDLRPGALNELASLRALRSVFFKEMQIDNTIFDALRKMPRLTYVDLSVCKFQTSAYRDFLRLRPQVQIAFTPQAFLGVRGPVNFADDGGCQISEVIPNSGADQGGLEIGDIIKTVNGQKIQRFEDLRLHIAQHKVGETLDLRVDRDGEKVDLQITLGRYDSNLR